MKPIRFRYQTLEFDETDLHIRCLKDNLQFNDEDGTASDLGISSAEWPLFGVIWDSGEVLANLMFDFDIKSKKILEVGCGIGLASLILNQRKADITATDHHPEVENFLEENVRLNNGKKIPFIRTGWADQNSDLGKFDLIIGSDLLYHDNHIDVLSDFINRHLKEACEVILVDPGRGYHAKFSKKMIELGFSHSQSHPNKTDYLNKPFKGQILRYSR